MLQSKKVLVLYGGWNAERAVNLSSTPDVISALESKGHQVVSYDLDRDLVKFLNFVSQEKPDVVFNNIYGRFGEDGHIQGVLEIAGIPYTHSGLASSSAAMYKPFTQAILRDNNLPVADHMCVDELNPAQPPMDYPHVIKPCDEGSSVGVDIIHNADDYATYIADVLPQLRFPLMVERYIPGHELSIPVLDGKAYGVLELRPREGFYDYNAKCVSGVTAHIYPAPLEDAITHLCLHYAQESFRVLRCQGLARVDIRFDNRQGTNGLYILEVNPQPGLTSLSIAPEVMAHNGFDFPTLLDWIVRHPRCPE